jgi:acetyltransferase-like isoleucine patch superfamily enzyme
MNQPRLLSAGIKDVSFGSGVTIVEPSNIYGCTLGDGVFVGPFVEIQRGVIIGARTRIQSHTFICEGVQVGDDCFIAHGVMFVNDLFRTGGASRDPADWKGVKIGNRVSIGSGVTILPVSICDGVVIGAGAVVTRDITKPGVYVGAPARFLKAHSVE